MELKIREQFGEFECLFAPKPGSVPGYLKLLGLQNDALPAIEQLRDAVARSGKNLDAVLGSMLKTPNWRPQLVAATAMLVFKPSETSIANVWAAIDRPCWTSPQLAATASRVDPWFSVNAKIRIERRCQLGRDDTLKMAWSQRHSAQGPNSIAGHSAKLLSALIALCEPFRETTDWLALAIVDPEVMNLLESDVDRGGKIALNWLSKLNTLGVSPRD